MTSTESHTANINSVQMVVASRNPVKISAAKLGYQRIFPAVVVEAQGTDCESGVGDQPRSDDETRRGATLRAAAARQMQPDADVWVGIEGGIDTIGDNMFAFAWAVIETKDCRGESRSGTFLLPQSVRQIIEQGEELGKAIDIVYGQTNSKQQGGAIGILSGGQISRTQLYEHAVALALMPLVQLSFEAETVSAEADPSVRDAHAKAQRRKEDQFS